MLFAFVGGHSDVKDAAMLALETNVVSFKRLVCLVFLVDHDGATRPRFHLSSIFLLKELQCSSHFLSIDNSATNNVLVSYILIVFSDFLLLKQTSCVKQYDDDLAKSW